MHLGGRCFPHSAPPNPMVPTSSPSCLPFLFEPIHGRNSQIVPAMSYLGVPLFPPLIAVSFRNSPRNWIGVRNAPLARTHTSRDSVQGFRWRSVSIYLHEVDAGFAGSYHRFPMILLKHFLPDIEIPHQVNIQCACLTTIK